MAEQVADFVLGSCCLATSGPGAIHLLNGLYDAKLDHQPFAAIVGQQKRISQDAHYQQEVALENLFADVSVAEYYEKLPGRDK